jgi:hypothetical protein
MGKSLIFGVRGEIRKLTDIFSVESEVAKAIADQSIKNMSCQCLPTRYSHRMDISLNSLEQALLVRRQIDTLENRLSALLGHAISPDSTTPKGHRHVSAATRAKLAAAARARWARSRRSQTVSAPAKKKGGLTPAGRRRLSQLMKARWGSTAGSSRSSIS